MEPARKSFHSHFAPPLHVLLTIQSCESTLPSHVSGCHRMRGHRQLESNYWLMSQGFSQGGLHDAIELILGSDPGSQLTLAGGSCTSIPTG